MKVPDPRGKVSVEAKVQYKNMIEVANKTNIKKTDAIKIIELVKKTKNDKISLNTILQINGYKTFIDQDSYELWVRRDNETEWKKYKLPINSDGIIKELVTNIERE